MEIDMTEESFCICGGFAYPLIQATDIADFIQCISTSDSSDLICNCIKVKSEDFDYYDGMKPLYDSVNIHVSEMIDRDYALINCTFMVDNTLDAEFHITFLNASYYEVSLMLSNAQLNTFSNEVQNKITESLTALFFHKLKPIYGCCGVETFVEPPDELNQQISDCLFYRCGYINKGSLNLFDRNLVDYWKRKYSVSETEDFLIFKSTNKQNDLL